MAKRREALRREAEEKLGALRRQYEADAKAAVEKRIGELYNDVEKTR